MSGFYGKVFAPPYTFKDKEGNTLAFSFNEPEIGLEGRGEINIVFNDRAIVVDVSILTELVNILIGSDTNKSVRAIATEVLSPLIEGAPETLDTLKEIAEWLKNHQDIGTALTELITQHSNDIAALNTRIIAIENEFEDGGRVKNAEGAIESLNNKTSVIETDIKSLNDALWGEGESTDGNMSITEISGILSTLVPETTDQDKSIRDLAINEIEKTGVVASVKTLVGDDTDKSVRTIAEEEAARVSFALSGTVENGKLILSLIKEDK